MAAIPDSSPSSRPASGPGWRAGTVTRLGVPGSAFGGAETPEPKAAPDPARADRRRLMLFGGAAGAVLAVGVAVVLAVTMNGDPRPIWDRKPAASDQRPPLVRLCGAPTAAAPPPAEPAEPTGPPPTPAPSGRAPAGPRTVDTESGISYRAYGPPWEPWNTVWRAGTLEVPYKIGQHIVTEVYPGGTYHASILSAAVPAADNDAIGLNLECVGRQVAADVRAEYYPQPTTMDLVRDERTVLGGRPAWVTVFRLHFHAEGLKATSELVGVACIDVGTPLAAVLYVSIPETHRQLDWVVADALASVRTA